ncbi:MAG: biotin--[acetyl-CoA-carboxylase] ligase [Chloroflexi bacterium]|nr:biotin--[acetyl-CoA-carboxylase] ligase [Chloroflexota bacterium]
MSISTGATPATDWLARIERFEVVGSTNDIVADWLRDGTPEVCVAIADEQVAGRGRNGRTWSAPAGASLLASVGFRPTWLEPPQAWRLGALVSLAMADAAESTAGLPTGTVRLKWPNDLVILDGTGAALKVAGVLGETEGLGTPLAQAVIGIGINVDWARGSFPAEFAASMTSLSEAAAGREVGRDALTQAFLARLEPLTAELRGGRFAADAWRRRQLTNGLPVRLEWPDGEVETVTAVDVDPDSGALLVRPVGSSGQPRPVLVGEIRHLRFGGVV